jgi:hypothetical protein
VTPPEIRTLEQLVPNIIDTMRAHPDVLNSVGEPVPVPWLKNFPSGSCDITSLTIASVLSDLGLGDWELVSAFDDKGIGHTWLRLRVVGQITMSVDATLHQFEDWNEPWIGEGDSPAASRFVNVRHEHLFSKVPDWWPRGHEMEVATWTRSKIREAVTIPLPPPDRS